ncbi:MAG: bifunctional nicotinamidase/pyrazinamidase [Deltaproteobacteria bacterium]|nr:bifunctional nicotinamidase/pyrazinamidase [Deltaproteobacteria bacterium]
MKTLLVVDVQNDFCPGGALAVNRGDEVVDFINARRDEFPLVIFTQDWHPAGHASFASSNPGTQVGQVIQLGGVDQIMWPDHCVQGTHGAEFHKDLQVRAGDPVFRKGQDSAIDSYSAFVDNDGRLETGLRAFLQDRNIGLLEVVGLATDYCVLFSVLDGLRFGFSVQVNPGGCRAVNLDPDDEERAYRQMRDAGAVIV